MGEGLSISKMENRFIKFAKLADLNGDGELKRAEYCEWSQMAEPFIKKGYALSSDFRDYDSYVKKQLEIKYCETTMIGDVTLNQLGEVIHTNHGNYVMFEATKLEKYLEQNGMSLKQIKGFNPKRQVNEFGRLNLYVHQLVELNKLLNKIDSSIEWGLPNKSASLEIAQKLNPGFKLDWASLWNLHGFSWIWSEPYGNDDQGNQNNEPGIVAVEQMEKVLEGFDPIGERSVDDGYWSGFDRLHEYGNGGAVLGVRKK